MTLTIRTRSKAPLAIVHIGRHLATGAPIATLEGYAYSMEAARRRARRLGFRYGVFPIADGRITIEVPA